MASISLRHIYKSYPRDKKEKKKEIEQNISPFAVKDFNLEIKDGEFIVLVGPSGCGKSTTLRMIAGLEDISGGELYIDDILSNNIDASKRNIAMVFQNYALYPHMTSFGNMAYGLKLRKVMKPVLTKEDKLLIKNLRKKYKSATSVAEKKLIRHQITEIQNRDNQAPIKLAHYSKEEIEEKVYNAAEILDIIHLLDRKPSEMSGGQRQRVALGRALVRDPKVFLLDEPLSNLDAKLRASMRSEIVKVHERVKTTFVYVTHDQVEAMTMGDRIVVMKDGIIQQVGSPREIYDHPVNTFVAGFIGTPQMNFFDIDFIASAKNIEITLPNETSIKYDFKDFNEMQNPYINGNKKSLVLGIRGEHIAITTKGIPATVEFVEILGNATNILCRLEDSDVEFNISVQERSALLQGDKIHVSFEPKYIHLFDKETGESIYTYAISEVNQDEK